MNYRFLLPFCAGLALAACQMQEQREARLNQKDNDKCVTQYGLQFGTPAYADCRLRLAESRAADARVVDNSLTCSTYYNTTHCY